MPIKYDLSLSPDTDCEIPDGDGYYICRSLFGSDHPPANAGLETFTASMLMDGTFGPGDERHTKTVSASETYTLRVGVSTDAEATLLDEKLAPYLDGTPLDIDGEAFHVTDADRTEASFDDLLAEAAAYTAPEVTMQFKTPTCVVHPRSTITEMFPHRRSIFPQLAARWNAAVGETGRTFALDPFDVGAQIFEKPDARSYRTFSTLTDYKTDADGTKSPFVRQGYIGKCAYAFRNEDRTVREAVVALALFAEYCGIGVDTHHGCGCVNVSLYDHGASR